MFVITAWVTFAGELRDLEKQLNEGGLSAHELEKAKKRLEQEKEELAQSLEVHTGIVQTNIALHQDPAL